jgi:lipid-A-disaccharide synthase
MQNFDQQIDQGTRIVAVLPGSRGNEVRGNFPIMLQAIRNLHQRHPDVRFVVAACRNEHQSWCREQLSRHDHDLPMDFLVGKTSEVIEAAECAMMVSGSVSLELMARRTPAAVIYRVGRFLHAVGSRLVQVDSLTLPNLIAGRKIFPEFVSVGPTDPAVEFLEASVDAMLSDSFYYHSLLRDLDKMRSSSAASGASSRVASEICQLLGSPDADSDPELSGPELSIRRAA